MQHQDEVTAIVRVFGRILSENSETVRISTKETEMKRQDRDPSSPLSCSSTLPLLLSSLLFNEILLKQLNENMLGYKPIIQRLQKLFLNCDINIRM